MSNEYIHIAELNDQVKKLLQLLEEKDVKINSLTATVESLKNYIFGNKSEKQRLTESPFPINTLFSELNPVVKTEIEEGAETQQITYTRKKEKKKIESNDSKWPEHLPRVEKIIIPKGIDESWRKFGEETTEVLEREPAKVFVRKIIRHKYINDKTKVIKIGEFPSRLVPKSTIGTSIVTEASVEKYVYHKPYYRYLEQLWQSNKIKN